MGICQNLHGKIRKNASSELIFGGFGPFGTTPLKKGEKNQEAA